MTLYYERENSSVMDTKCESEGNSTDKNFRVDPKEFYKTYDVMTGIRIAATLSSFFGLMVILVLYKSKSKTEKALEDPEFTAAAVAEVEEEDRQLQAVLNQTAYEELNPRRSRRSLDTNSMPPGWIRNTKRFSSVGGYSSLMEPPTRALPRLPCFIDEDSPPEYDDVSYNYSRHLNVPRRSSNITCSSSGSSYLERRDSAVALGLPALPAHKSKYLRRQSSPLPEIYDFYYPIDIRVTQPTPGGSPCGSDRALYDRVGDPPNLKPKLAPLASISSCNTSIGMDFPDYDVQSYASDSVFRDNDDDENTDNEIEEFSTDSEEGACYQKKTDVSTYEVAQLADLPTISRT
ncbi:uncharacterized protein LOC109598391 isoform X2 [Aethina tumida]|uniref:uncharacterized protein LOC109598391 isoform X2 n=1 Tax=Aethina tumida TaxID=116153 RepID=UPI0021474D31|nr:uncharacterized protein LOC109598391 isoform X2 [Aethina tumida]